MSKHRKIKHEYGSYARADLDGFVENLNMNFDAKYYNVSAWRNGDNKILKVYYPVENAHNLMDLLQPINFNVKYYRFMTQLKKNSQMNGIYNPSTFDEVEIKTMQNLLEMTHLPTVEFIYVKHVRNKEFEYILPKQGDSVIVIVPRNYHNTYETGTYNTLFRILGELNKLEVM